MSVHSALRRFRIFSLVAVFGAATIAAHAQPAAEPSMDEATDAGGMKTVAVAAIGGYDSLLEDIGFLGDLAGRPGTADMLRGMIPMFTQGRDVKAMGLDTTRPLGVVLRADGVSFAPIVCLPITDLDATLEVVEAFGFAPADVGDGIIELELPERTLFLKSDGEWTFAAQSPDAFDAAPADPGPMLQQLVAEYDLCVRVLAPNVPEIYKQLALEQLRAGMEQGLVQLEDESDEEFDARAELAEAQVEQLTDAIESIDELTAGWRLDAEAGSTHLDLAFTILPGSKLAPAVAVYQDTTTRFAGFHNPAAAMSMLAVGDTPPEMLDDQREQLESTIQVLRTQADQALEEDEVPESMRDALKSAASDLIDVYEEMVFSGKGDIGVSLDLASEGFALIGAIAVPTPEKVEAALKKLAEAWAENPELTEAPEVAWDAETHAGVRMHQVAVAVPESGQARQMIGETLTVTVGIGPDAAYLGVGPTGAEALKKAIDTSRSRDGEEVLPFELMVSVKQVVDALAPFANDENAQVFAMLGDALAEVAEGTDHLRVSARPIENGLIIRYEAEEGVLRAAGKAAMAAQQAALQGGGF